MHIFSHKTVQLFVRSLRGYTKSFCTEKVDLHYWEQLTSLLKRLTLFLRKLTAYSPAVSILQTICI